MEKKKNSSPLIHKTLTSDELKRYEAGEMSFEEMHRIEKILLEQPFYADAVEGLGNLKKDSISKEKALDDLKTRLQKRTQKPKKSPTPVFNIISIWKPISIAAAVLLVFSGTFYFIKQTNKSETVSLIVAEPQDNLSGSSSDTVSKTISNQPQAEAPIAFNEKPQISASKVDRQPTDFKNSVDVQKEIKEEAEHTISSSNISKAADINETDRIAELQAPAAAPVISEKKADARTESVPASAKYQTGGGGRMSTATVSGILYNDENKPMADVAVNIKGAAKGTRTDEEGKFYIEGLKKGDILVLNSLHLPTQEVVAKNVYVGTIVYSEENATQLNKPKISVRSPNEFLIEKTIKEAKPEFGWDAYAIYLRENTQKPEKAIEANIKGRVTVKFKINEQGKLSDFQVVKSLGYGCDEEAIRVIKDGPQWFPALQNEKKLSTTRQVIVKF